MGFNLKHVTKLTAVICSCLLIIVSITSFAVDTLTPISAILDIYYIFFGISLVCSEWDIVYVVDNFRLLAGYYGRGVFCIFLGTILLDDTDSSASGVLSLAIGIVFLVVGICYGVVGFKTRNETTTTEQNKAASVPKTAEEGIQQGNQQDIQSNA